MKTGIVFEPYVCRLLFSEGAVRTRKDRHSNIGGFMEAIARDCVASGPCLIGHIKGFSQILTNGYLKASVIDSIRPVEVVDTMDEILFSLNLDLNVHVYGLDRDTIDRIVRNNISSSDSPWHATVSFVDLQEKDGVFISYGLFPE